MSVNSAAFERGAGSTLSVRQATSGRVEFRMRIPAVGDDAGGSQAAGPAPSLPEVGRGSPIDGPSDDHPRQPRGMRILRRILDRRSQAGWPILRQAREHRIRLAVIGLTGLACLLIALAVKHGRETDDPIEGASGDEFVDVRPDDSSAADPSISAFARAPSGASMIETGDEHSVDEGVQPVSYRTVQSPPRGAWLEGTILPDEAEQRPKVEWSFPSGRTVP